MFSFAVVVVPMWHCCFAYVALLFCLCGIVVVPMWRCCFACVALWLRLCGVVVLPVWFWLKERENGFKGMF